MSSMFDTQFQLVSVIAIAVQFTIIVGVILRVMLTRHPPGSAFAWILISVIFPYVGFILYLLLGEQTLGRWHSRRIRNEMRRRRLRFHHNFPTINQTPSQYRGICRLANRLGRYPITRNSSLSLISDSEQIIESIIDDIEQAKSVILMEFYIWDIDGAANKVSEALIRAAQRGVECFVLVDAIGSSDFLKSEWPKRFASTGIHLERALRVSLFSAFFARADIRLHRKMIVIDHKIGYSGSMNVVDPIFFKRDDVNGQWVDAMVRLKGEIVANLNHLIAFDWSILTDSKTKIPVSDDLDIPFDPIDQACVMLIPSGPDTNYDANQRILLDAIHNAKRQIRIVTPYFVPGEALFFALQNAAIRGVKVELIVPKESDSKLVTYASHRYFDDLLQCGVRIFLFENGVLHTKSISIDGELTLFGTLNMDMRSMNINYELMLLTIDDEFSQKINHLHDQYLAQCKGLTLATWYRRSIFKRIKEGASYLLSPLL